MLRKLDSLVPVDKSKIEQDPSVFYGRLNTPEVEIVRSTVGDVAEYMEKLGAFPYFIAGVGGILRKENPGEAKDIDLAVVGLNYVRNLAEEHSFNDVIDFTEKVYNFFDHLTKKMTDSKGPQRLSSKPVGMGSGPFSYLDSILEGDSGEFKVRVNSDVEKFSPYSSKGLQINYKGHRPIDVQFTFNLTHDLWVLNQTFKDNLNGKSPLYYSILHKGKK